jgi:menaquinone reductase, iron-sulfur cluster-binding subunit
MARWGMVIDLQKCTGCGACIAACKEENNVPYVTPDEAEAGRAISWMQMVNVVEGDFPNVHMKNIPRPCMQCDNPPCVKVCPVHATFRDEEGIVGQIYERCIGCRYCMSACPYSVKYFNWYEPLWGDVGKGSLNPDVSLRKKGVVEKCTFCHHRLQKSREKARAKGLEVVDGEYSTACADTCPTRAIAFGDLNDPNSAVAALSKSKRAFRMLEDLGTDPKVIYLTEGEKNV